MNHLTSTWHAKPTQVLASATGFVRRRDVYQEPQERKRDRKEEVGRPRDPEGLDIDR